MENLTNTGQAKDKIPGLEIRSYHEQTLRKINRNHEQNI